MNVLILRDVAVMLEGKRVTLAKGATVDLRSTDDVQALLRGGDAEEVKAQAPAYAAAQKFAGKNRGASPENK